MFNSSSLKFLSKFNNISKVTNRLFSSQPAHGSSGVLVNRVLPQTSDEYKEYWNKSGELFELVLSPRNTCDIELILNGAFSPLNGFMTSKDYNGVVNNLELQDGTIFPMPINLDISEEKVCYILHIVYGIWYVYINKYRCCK